MSSSSESKIKQNEKAERLCLLLSSYLMESTLKMEAVRATETSMKQIILISAYFLLSCLLDSLFEHED
jgi:hypothetical protein